MQREDEAGDISAGTLADARRFLDDLRTRLDAQPLKDAGEQEHARKFIAAASALVRTPAKAEHPTRDLQAWESQGHLARQPAGVHARL